MKTTEIERADDGQRKQDLQKINQNIKRIESIIKELLDGVKISELTPEKRLILGARFIALHQRAIALRHSFELDYAGDLEDLEMTKLMRFMRGEPEIEASEAIRVVDAIGDARPATPYRESPGLE